MERIPTGVKGLDSLIEGGFPKGSSILYTGPPGTGKTIFAIEYLYRGAAESNEKTLYITFEQQQEDLVEQAKQFGWDLLTLQQGGKFIIMSIPADSISVATSKMIIEKWPKRGRQIQVLGPVEAPITKLKGKYRWQILVKSKQAGLLHEFLDRVEGMARKSLRSSGVSMIVDVDPYQML